MVAWLFIVILTLITTAATFLTFEYYRIVELGGILGLILTAVVGLLSPFFFGHC